MDKLRWVFALVKMHGGKLMYIASAVIFLEFAYLYMVAASDGKIDDVEAAQLEEAGSRVVRSLS